MTQITDVLTGLDGDCGPLAANWVRSAVETIAGKVVKNGGALPISALEKFVADTSHSPRGRRLAYELIASVDKSAEQRLIPGLINDPSLELRRDAVALAMQRAAASEEEKKDKAHTIALYQSAFAASRDVDQIKVNADKLKALGEKPDIAGHMGFVMKWKLVAPFDNVNQKGFDVVYPPEQGVDLTATYQGKDNKKVAWIATVTDDDYGMVNLNNVIDKHKGAIAYAFAEFNAAKEQDVELRYGCINANKIWLNGEQLSYNAIYHTGQYIDQYVGRGRLKKGRNEILLKVAQNEQTENWRKAGNSNCAFATRLAPPFWPLTASKRKRLR